MADIRLLEAQGGVLTKDDLNNELVLSLSDYIDFNLKISTLITYLNNTINEVALNPYEIYDKDHYYKVLPVGGEVELWSLKEVERLESTGFFTRNYTQVFDKDVKKDLYEALGSYSDVDEDTFRLPSSEGFKVFTNNPDELYIDANVTSSSLAHHTHLYRQDNDETLNGYEVFLTFGEYVGYETGEFQIQAYQNASSEIRFFETPKDVLLYNRALTKTQLNNKAFEVYNIIDVYSDSFYENIRSTTYQGVLNSTHTIKIKDNSNIYGSNTLKLLEFKRLDLIKTKVVDFS